MGDLPDHKPARRGALSAFRLAIGTLVLFCASVSLYALVDLVWNLIQQSTSLDPLAVGWAIGLACSTVLLVPLSLGLVHRTYSSYQRERRKNLSLRRTIDQINERKKMEDPSAARLVDYAAVFLHNPQPMFIYEMEFLRFCEVNDAACEFYGYSREELLGLTVLDLSPPEDIPTLLAKVPEDSVLLAKSGPWRLLRKSGEIRYVEVASHSVQFAGKPARLVSATDVTDRRQTEEALRQSELRFRLVGRLTFDAVWDWDLATGFLQWNESMEDIFGYSTQELGSSIDWWKERVHPEDRDRVLSTLKAITQSSDQHIWSDEYRFRNADGTYANVIDRGYLLQDVTGEPIRMIGAMIDITQRKRLEEQLIHDAFHDSLTGLPNRALFMDRLGHAIESERRQDGSIFAVLFLDLDHFKTINDTLGHEFGDQLLVAAAQRLHECLRPGDSVARLGGDEFTVLMMSIVNINDATRVAERILKELSHPFHIGQQKISTTTSIGIALSTTGYTRSQDIIKDADRAMYRAKSMGRNRYEIFDTEMHARAVAHLQLESELNRALEQGQFRVRYQPIIALETGRLAGFEALIRWEHPENGLIRPAEFLPAAEETGLSIPIGRFVLDQACRQMAEWQRLYPSDPPLEISVNLSSRLIHPDHVEHIKHIMEETGLNARTLKLDISERALAIESVATMLLDLKALNVRLEIDDFGTGYSSLGRLHKFPLNTLKIDQSFVGQMCDGNGNTSFVRTVVDLAHNLHMDVAAEGIESAEQLAQLRALNCKYGQGYYFSEPLDSLEAEQLIAAGRTWP